MTALPGGSNTYVRSYAASGKLKVEFSRNPNKFDLPDYAQLKKTSKDEGYYLRINVEQAGRLVGGELDETVWADGADRPQHNDGTEQFAWLPFRTQRHAFPFKLGQKAREQADWDITGTHGAIAAQRAMTSRTRMAVKTLTTTGNWDASHISAVSAISGNTGPWDVSTVARQDIKRSLFHAAELIDLDTLGAVNQSQLHIVMDPTTAKAISMSQEIVDHIKGSPDAYAQVIGKEGKFHKYGLPDTLYGFPVTIERAVMTTSRRGTASATKSRVMPTGNVFMLSKVGELGAENEGPEFSTLTIFAYEEMTVESKDDTDHRRHLGSVVDDVCAVLTAPATGFWFTGATS
ncbi:MAG: hypothetical protein KF752_11745 [Pirellulaceae bacterium]|nr:hypothetical protein [Pirellulaceae bacterium]